MGVIGVFAEDEALLLSFIFFHLWESEIDKGGGQIFHDIVDVTHNEIHGPGKDVKGETLMFFRLVFFDLFDFHLIVLSYQLKGTSILRMAPLLP